MAEQGFPGIGTNAWQALFAPAATPKPILDKLHAAVVAVLSRPEMKESACASNDDGRGFGIAAGVHRTGSRRDAGVV